MDLSGILKGKISKGEELFPEIIGQENAKRQMASALLAGRNVIIVGFPGVGKTTLAKSVAKLLPGKKFMRLQGSPDLQVEHLLGDIDPVKALKYGPDSKEAFSPGKLLKADGGVVFFDELNRCAERLQNALLQVIEEKVATIGGFDIDYPANFVFIATMNPTEYVGTERLSEVLLDRFDIVEMEYPEDVKTERGIVVEKGKKLGVSVSGELLGKIVEIVRATRNDERIERPAGVRASIGLYERVQTNATLHGRQEAALDDLYDVAVSVLAHRMKLSPKARYATSAEEIVREILKKSEIVKKN